MHYVERGISCTSSTIVRSECCIGCSNFNALINRVLIVESFDLSIVLNYGTVHIIKDVLIIDINIGMKKGYFVIISLFIISFKAIRHIMVAVSIRKLFQRFAVHLIRQLHLNGQELLNHRIDRLAEVCTYCKRAES